MKKLILIGFLLCGFLSVNAFAEGVPLQITEGRFFIPFNNVPERSEAQFSTGLFSASSFLGGYYSPWYEVCGPSTLICRPGRTFSTPQHRLVYVGGCIGCSGPQFASGTFKINGVTYENVRFSGEFLFSRETFSIPRLLARKGSKRFRKPFTMTGRLKVCSVRDPNYYDCPADKILFDGQVSGRGDLTATMQIRRADSSIGNFSYLQRESFEYQFTQ